MLKKELFGEEGAQAGGLCVHVFVCVGGWDRGGGSVEEIE